MEISKEIINPVPPPTEYRLMLTEEEYEVLKAAVAVANFSEVRRVLEKRRSIYLDRADNVLYKIHNTFSDWRDN